MEHSEFDIGLEFYMGSGKWRCTDVGTRTIVAIKLDNDDETDFDGPLYQIAVEYVLDEYDFGGCDLIDRFGDDDDECN